MGVETHTLFIKVAPEQDHGILGKTDGFDAPASTPFAECLRSVLCAKHCPVAWHEATHFGYSCTCFKEQPGHDFVAQSRALERQSSPPSQDISWEFGIINDLGPPLVVFQFVVRIRQSMFWFGTWSLDSTLIGHPGWRLFTLLLLQVSECRGNSDAHGVHQRIRKRIHPSLPHHLVEQLHGSQKNTERALCPSGDCHVLPALLLRQELALQLLDQVIINRTSHLLRRSIPRVAHTHLPEIRVEPGEVGQYCVQIGLRGLRAEPRACFFRKGSERKM